MSQLLVVFIVLSFFVFPASAHAYLDPGTGSFIFQIAIASGLALLFAFKNFGLKIKELFTKKSKPAPTRNEQKKNSKGK
jgi:hypothetical protein